MSYESELMDYLITMRMDASQYAVRHKTLYYRQLLICFSLILCRILTIEQMKMVLGFSSAEENILRKNLSTFCSGGRIIRESFDYDNRYATYSLSKSGLAWIISQLPLLKQLSLSEDSLCELYQIRRKDKLSNHLVCINQIKLCFLCAGQNALHIHLDHERPFSINHNKPPLQRQKGTGQIIPDLFFQYETIPVYLEADTTSVRFDAAKGPGEKISKYTMLCNPSEKARTCLQAHILFSVQKNWGELENCNVILSRQETDLFGNPDKTNQAVSIVRLTAGLHNAYQTPELVTLKDILSYLRNTAPLLERQLVQGPLMCNASLLLHSLISHGFGDWNISEIRRSIAILTKSMQEDIKNHKLEAANRVSEKRKKELYQRILSSKHILYGCEHGISISCACGYTLHHELPALLPSLYFPGEQMERVLKNCGILSDSDHFYSYAPSLPCRCSKLDTSQSTLCYDTILNNAYQFYKENGEILTIFMENISDDIGGYLRVRNYLKLPPGFLKNTLLLLIIRDDLIMADGKTVWDGGLYYNTEGTDVARFTDPQTGQKDRTSLHILNHFISQCRDSALPYLYGSTQDYAYLTYTDLQKASFQPVTPIMFVPGKNDVIERKSDPNAYFNPCNYFLSGDISCQAIDFLQMCK